MSYRAFTFSAKTEYIFTQDISQALEKQLKRIAPVKLFVLASAARFHIVEDVLERLHLPYVLRSDGMPDPTSDFVDSCAAQIRETHCTFLLSVGGGSTIDAAKAAALLAANPTDGGIWDYIGSSKEPRNAALPVGVIVTIPSTGSESNPSAVISNPRTQEKRIYTQASLQPIFSITSPELTYTLPAYYAAAGIADILSHLLEQYLHNDSHVEVSDNMLLGVMKAVIQWGPISIEQPENYDAKANLLWAGYLAMSQVLGAGHDQNWISHMVEHALSAQFALSHGAGMSIVIPAYVEMIEGCDLSGRLARLTKEAFDLPEQSAAVLLRAFFASLGLPATLSQAGIVLTAEDAKICASKSLPWGPMKVAGYGAFTEAHVLALLEKVR